MNTAPFLMVIPKGRRGRVSGSEIIWAVSGNERECVRHAREKVAKVVGMVGTKDLF